MSLLQALLGGIDLGEAAEDLILIAGGSRTPPIIAGMVGDVVSVAALLAMRAVDGELPAKDDAKGIASLADEISAAALETLLSTVATEDERQTLSAAVAVVVGIIVREASTAKVLPRVRVNASLVRKLASRRIDARTLRPVTS